MIVSICRALPEVRVGRPARLEPYVQKLILLCSALPEEGRFLGHTREALLGKLCDARRCGVGRMTSQPCYTVCCRQTAASKFKKTKTCGPVGWAKAHLRRAHHQALRAWWWARFRFANPTACELICFARKRNLGTQLRQNNTTGKSVQTCPVPLEKIFRLTRRPNQLHNSARLTADEGRSRSSRTCGEMRWTLMAR